MDTPIPGVISIPQIVYDVPAIYRRKFGPFAVMEVIQDPEPVPVVVKAEAPSAFAALIYRAACYFAAAGIVYSLVKVYL